MRDMISGLPVQVLRRGEWNAAAAALGAALFLLLRELGTPDLLRDLLAFAVIVLARYASLLFGWQTVEAGDLGGASRAGAGCGPGAGARTASASGRSGR